MGTTFNKIQHLGLGLVDAQLDPSGTALTLDANHNFADARTPCVAVLCDTPISDDTLLAGEWVKVTDVTGNTATLVRDLRNDFGGVGGTWIVGSHVRAMVYAEDVQRLADYANHLEGVIWTMTGRSTSGGVLRFGAPPGDTGLKVVQDSPLSMNVDVNPGAAIYNSGQPFNLSAATEIGPFSVPVTSSRNDLIEILDGVLTIKEGAEGGGVPSVDSGGLALASVLVTTSHVQVVTGDISDLRVFI